LSETVKSPANIENLLEEILRKVSQDTEYLTVNEVARRLKVTAKTVRNRMASGIYQKDVHYFCPSGSDKRGRPWSSDPLFKWSAIVGWVEGEKPSSPGMVFPVLREKD
jgi:hypothetical protein